MSKDKSNFKPVVPNKNSDFKNFTNAGSWKGVADFYDQRKTAEDSSKMLFMTEEQRKEFLHSLPAPELAGRRKMRLNIKQKEETYPRSNKYYYTTQLVNIDFDKEMQRDVARGKCILITEPQGIKKDLKDIHSIYSPLFGPAMDDADISGNKYSCECGHLTSQQNEGMVCPICNTKVKYKADDLKMFGWIVLKNDVIIHQGLYYAIKQFLGPTIFNNMLEVKDEKDEDGFSIKAEPPKNEPFYDIGMIGFHDKFDEIMEFYRHKYSSNPAKVDLYNYIMANRDIVFTHSIPVYTTLLRPYRLKDGNFAFEGVNPFFNMLAKLGAILNGKQGIHTDRMKKSRNQLLYDMQYNIMEVYDEVLRIMSTKKGSIRALYGIRANFTARTVIIPESKLRTDQVTLPYHALCKLLEARIINVLCHGYGMQMSEARHIWEDAQRDYDPRVHLIIRELINATPEGLPILINRNPTLNYGSILQMYCTGITGDEPEILAMGIPLLILPALNADFDGDK